MATLLSIILGVFLDNPITKVPDSILFISISTTDTITKDSRNLAILSLTNWCEIYCIQNYIIKMYCVISKSQYFGSKRVIFLKHGPGSTCHLADKTRCVQSFIHIDATGPRFVLMPGAYPVCHRPIYCFYPDRHVFEGHCHDDVIECKLKKIECFLHYWPFVGGFHWSTMGFLYKGSVLLSFVVSFDVNPHKL